MNCGREGVPESFLGQGKMAALPASYFCIRAFAETDLAEELKMIVRRREPPSSASRVYPLCNHSWALTLAASHTTIIRNNRT
jgi:hypothetical protein